jgi:hypothetical protein
VSNIRTITGGKPVSDRAAELAEAVKALCYEQCEGMSLAAVIGALEIAKLELIETNKLAEGNR